MKLVLKLLILAVAVTVLSAWTFRLEMDTIYRGADASNMIEEFQAYGLNQTTMIVVGIFKVMCAIFLLLGLKFEKFVTPAAFIMGTSFKFTIDADIECYCQTGCRGSDDVSFLEKLLGSLGKWCQRRFP